MPGKLPQAQRRLLHEMAKDARVILVQKHPKQLVGVRFSINSFPIRTVRPAMVTNLARTGHLTLNRRGYYVLTSKGQLVASLYEERKRS